MIIVKLRGGLGNQMFQYAAGFSLAKKLKTKLYLDVSWYSNQSSIDTIRSYDLNCFKLSSNFAPTLINNYLNVINDKFSNYKSLLLWLVNFKIIKEKNFAYNKNFKNLNGNLFLDGYWASEKYFSDISSQIKSEFKFKNKLDYTNISMLNTINYSNSVSIHVRRGDYVSNLKTKAYHGVCSIPYYQKAVKFIVKKITHPKFIIFSDDIAWCKSNLNLDYNLEYVDDSKYAWQDLNLMSLCNHHIIANSTFSWWGAWLGTNTYSINIAPKMWFADKSINTSDLIPHKWFLL